MEKSFSLIKKNICQNIGEGKYLGEKHKKQCKSGGIGCTEGRDTHTNGLRTAVLSS